jgi:hypothetical protein
MKSAIRWMVVLLAAGTGAFAQPTDKAALVRRQQELTAESELAREPKFYFVLDVRERNLELRVKGMALRTWKLRSMRFWGQPAFSRTVQLVRKSTLNPPQRNIIKPGETTATKDPAKFELEALELKDMPRSFSLEFDNGLHVSVKAAATGLRGLVENVNWYAILPVKNFLSSRDGKPMSELELSFENERDAQAIYWIFFEGIKGLVY